MQKERNVFEVEHEICAAAEVGNVGLVELYLKELGDKSKELDMIIRRIINAVPVESLTEQHFTLMQYALTLHDKLDASIIKHICQWLICVKEHPQASRVLTILIDEGHISACSHDAIHKIDDFKIINDKTFIHKLLSREMTAAIEKNDVDAFKKLLFSKNLEATFEIYHGILRHSLEQKSYDIIIWLLENYPFYNVKEPDRAIECIALLHTHLYAEQDQTEQLILAKICLLKYIALSHALAPNRSKMRSKLEDLVKNLLIKAEIAQPKTLDLQVYIDLLIQKLNPQYREAAIAVPHNPDANAFRRFLLWASYVSTYITINKGDKYDRRNFLDDTFMLGMIPGAKCGFRIIELFKTEKNKELGLVVTCLEDFEIRWQTLLFTPASPEYWKNLGIKQIHVPIQDFGHKVPKEFVFKAVDIMHEVKKKNLGIYTHCKAGIGRSFFLSVLY
ncbi:MAG: hypothetical protein M3R00_00600, partial [Pseudomonadota bacterium]|nr:hypothetical protein [Pseudomonadota bacterium]